MSRIGKKYIEIPSKVSINLITSLDKKIEKVIVKGEFGKLEIESNNELILISNENNKLIFTKKNETRRACEYHGLIRSLIKNMIVGVESPFTRILIAEGVGYKFMIDLETSKKLIVYAGYSNPVILNIPNDINVKVESPTKIIIIGISKQQVGFFSSIIRAIRPPEPYKGKGILYGGEKIRRKIGKTGK